MQSDNQKYFTGLMFNYTAIFICLFVVVGKPTWRWNRGTIYFLAAAFLNSISIIVLATLKGILMIHVIV